MSLNIFKRVNILIKMDINYHYIFGFFVRLVLIMYGFFQDNILNVKYTDVDYQVFTDAAEYVLKGESPFKRHTYRYTPLLAYFLTPNILISNVFGKILFCSLDIVTSVLILHILKNLDYNLQICKNSSLLWLYNPLSMVISSRGNAESVMTTLVMLSIYFFQKNKPALCGIFYGLSVHFKIYPCIYAASFYFAFSPYINENYTVWDKFIVLFKPDKKKMLFVFYSAIGFLFPTITFYILYHEEYVWESLLYHLFRKDIRHNFSPYFYVLYLSEVMDNYFSIFLSVFALSLQLSTILLTALVFSSPNLLPSALFIETFLFVTLNKVCTSQYFSWYICLFPLVYPMLKITVKRIISAFVIWLLSQVLWLLPAYYLEFKGENTFFLIFIASLSFFSVNMYLIYSFVKCLKSSRSLENVKKNE